MSKVEKLVKQAEVFEHLAVYSDRTTFLKRLAQLKPVDDSVIYQALKGLDAGLVSWKRKHRNGTTELASTSNFTALIYRVVDSALPLTEDKLSQIDSACKELGVVPGELTSSEEKEDWFEMITKPASEVTKLIEERKQYAAETIPAVDKTLKPAIELPVQEMISTKSHSISKDLQTKLNSLLNEEPDGTPIPGRKPLSIDGVLGPETQAALKEFNKKYFKTELSNNELLDVLRNA